jgi:hypothetical protein
LSWPERSACGRFCSLIPGWDLKLSAIILAGSTVLSAVGASPPHDGRPCQAGAVDVADHDRGTLRREAECNSPADAVGRTRDNGDLGGEASMLCSVPLARSVEVMLWRSHLRSCRLGVREASASGQRCRTLFHWPSAPWTTSAVSTRVGGTTRLTRDRRLGDEPLCAETMTTGLLITIVLFEMRAFAAFKIAS